jgi:hypothetical protein
MPPIATLSNVHPFANFVEEAAFACREEGRDVRYISPEMMLWARVPVYEFCQEMRRRGWSVQYELEPDHFRCVRKSDGKGIAPASGRAIETDGGEIHAGS